MIPVIKLPSSGFPEDSSKTEPTAAIAATQEAPKKRALFGVTVITAFFYLWDWFDGLR